MKLIMPMAGHGSRFVEQGYSLPKPLISVNGIPMFVHSERCLGLDFSERVFITLKDHDLKNEIRKWYSDAIVVEISEVTGGAAETILTASEHLNDEDIWICNCDQHIEWDHVSVQKMIDNDIDMLGLIATFQCSLRDKKWSYVLMDDKGHVIEVAEKKPISDTATVGCYYWRNGLQFVESARQMIADKDKVNGEFYICPVYNHGIVLYPNKSIKCFNVDVMQGIGTPEDLKIFENWYEK